MPDISPHAPDVALTSTSDVTTTVHTPGDPVETVADAKAREQLESEPVADVWVNDHVTEYVAPLETHNAEANAASRSNIVVTGEPGTVGS